MSLREEVTRAGFYPELVLNTLEVSLAGEEVIAHLVQPETTFADSVHRHVTLLALTPTRLILVHVDDVHREDGVPADMSTNEAVSLQQIRSVGMSRGVVLPAAGGGQLTEMTVAIAWGSIRRFDLEPATCGDPNCQADHGLTGISTPDDVVVRISGEVEGAEALQQAEYFARALSAATANNAARHA